jgi:hypothetical protein
MSCIDHMGSGYVSQISHTACVLNMVGRSQMIRPTGHPESSDRRATITNRDIRRARMINKRCTQARRTQVNRRVHILRCTLPVAEVGKGAL